MNILEFTWTHYVIRYQDKLKPLDFFYYQKFCITYVAEVSAIEKKNNITGTNEVHQSLAEYQTKHLKYELHV